jgi:excisionase family DNA binding protein
LKAGLSATICQQIRKYIMKNNLIMSSENDQQFQNSDMLKFSEACTYLKVSKSFLYKATSERTITFYKPTGGKLIYFNKGDLDDWLNQNRYLSKRQIAISMLPKQL